MTSLRIDFDKGGMVLTRQHVRLTLILWPNRAVSVCATTDFDEERQEIECTVSQLITGTALLHSVERWMGK